MRLANRIAIVTGASRGLGPYVARALAAEHCAVVLAARSTPELETVAESVRAMGVKAIIATCDVTVAADRQRLVTAAMDEFGRIDVLVNNAGIELTAPFEKQDESEIEQVINVNLTSALLLTRAVLPGMLERKTGFIVNMASLAGKVGTPYSSPYAASKAGLILFTRSLRAELKGRGVSASAICPTFVSDAGMYDQMRKDTGSRAPLLAGVCTPQAVAHATIKSIKRDRPEMLVRVGPTRPIAVWQEAMPGVFERLYPLFGANKIFKEVALKRAKS
jgi:short-subunit dehydrogenase